MKGSVMTEDKNTYFYKSLMYVSKSSNDLEYDEILDILAHSWKYNHNSHISGMLLYDDRHFMQLIQGPILTVDTLYERISQDARHQSIKLIGEEMLSERETSGWGIGFYDKQEAADIFYDSFHVGHGEDLYDVKYEDAKSLLLILKNII